MDHAASPVVGQVSCPSGGWDDLVAPYALAADLSLRSLSDAGRATRLEARTREIDALLLSATDRAADTARSLHQRREEVWARYRPRPFEAEVAAFAPYVRQWKGSVVQRALVRGWCLAAHQAGLTIEARFTRALRQSRCSACGHQVLAASTERGTDRKWLILARRCGECGQSWPLLPPEIAR